MRKVVYLIAVMFCISYVYAQPPIVKFYQKDGSVKTYNISDIDELFFNNPSTDLVIKIYEKNYKRDVYPIGILSRIDFTLDSTKDHYLNLNISNYTKKYKLENIDSVIFYYLKTKIKFDGVAIDSASFNQIIKFSGDSIVFDRNSEIAKKLKAWDIIAGAPSYLDSNGFIKEIKKIITLNKEIILLVQDANLFNVITDGVVYFKTDLTPSDTGKGIMNIKNGDIIKSNRGFSLDYNTILFDTDENPETKNDQIRIKGNIDSKPTLTISFIIEYGVVRQFMVKLDVQSDISQKTEVTYIYMNGLSKSLNELLKIPPFTFKPMVVNLDWIPIVFTPTLEFFVGASINVKTETITMVDISTNVSTGLEYNPVEWKFFENMSNNYDFRAPVFSTDGRIRSDFAPVLKLSLYRSEYAMNSYTAASSNSELIVDLVKNPLWKFSGGATNEANIKSFWGHWDQRFGSFSGNKVIIAQSNDLITTVVPNNGKIGDIITVKGNNFGNSRNSNSILLTNPKSLSDYTEITEYEKWTNEEIIFKVPELSLGPKLLLLDIDDMPSNKVDFVVKDTKPIILSITPDSAEREQEILITGENFGDGRGLNFVKFNDILADSTDYIYWINNEISIKVPKNAKRGKITVNVNGTTSNEFQFTVKNDVEPIKDLVLIPAGTFQMGPTGKHTGLGVPSSDSVHQVTLTKSFFIGKYEVTQSLWKPVMGTNPSYFIGDSLPVENICWFEAIDFCNKLSDMEGLERCYTINMNSASQLCDTGVRVTWNIEANGYRLPTEAEWEYALKAGTSSDFYSGDLIQEFCVPDKNLDKIAWYCGNLGIRTNTVGKKIPNNFGLFDMSGNVSEWCWDGSYKYYSKPEIDPKNDNFVYVRQNRGGYFFSNAFACLSARRANRLANEKDKTLGFRICRTNK